MAVGTAILESTRRGGFFFGDFDPTPILYTQQFVKHRLEVLGAPVGKPQYIYRLCSPVISKIPGPPAMLLVRRSHANAPSLMWSQYSAENDSRLGDEVELGQRAWRAVLMHD